jgi:hypothetical protein
MNATNLDSDPKKLPITTPKEKRTWQQAALAGAY